MPRRYRTWAGRPGPGPFALEPDEWTGAGDWTASAVREVVLDVLDVLEAREAGTRMALTLAGA
ncbi:hypothetical protein ACO0LV_09365 [Pseudactinotalea sp. Z1739]|uniref:hypothetical protein n=1 Tax=Pseudactinotalea sp. Z1739 TaxID=3413028 RepID=UPI003C7DE5F9